jgi:hypothetical protein
LKSGFRYRLFFTNTNSHMYVHFLKICFAISDLRRRRKPDDFSTPKIEIEQIQWVHCFVYRKTKTSINSVTPLIIPIFTCISCVRCNRTRFPLSTLIKHLQAWKRHYFK